MRLSLGASRGQLIRQLLMESMVLSLAGGVIGIMMAFAMTRGLLTLVPAEGNPLLIRPEPDSRILFFTRYHLINNRSKCLRINLLIWRSLHNFPRFFIYRRCR